jgi:hypothetical protein
MACNDEDHGRSRRPDAEYRGWSHRSDTRWPGNREVRVALCNLHRTCGDEKRVFLGLA